GGGEGGVGGGGKVAGGAEVAGGKRGLGGGEIGLGEIALAAVSHGELAEAVRHLGLARHGGAQQRDRLVGGLHLVGGDERLGKRDADEHLIGGERGGAPQRGEGFRRMP